MCHISEVEDPTTSPPIQGEGKFRPGTISLGIISPGENFATLEIPKAPSAVRPNDGDNTIRHAPDGDSKIATHHHNKQAPAPPAPILPDQQHQIPYICARNGWLRRVGKCLALLRKHNPSAAVAKDGTVPPKISPGENFATVLNGEIFPAKFSPGKIFPPPVPHHQEIIKTMESATAKARSWRTSACGGSAWAALSIKMPPTSGTGPAFAKLATPGGGHTQGEQQDRVLVGQRGNTPP